MIISASIAKVGPVCILQASDARNCAKTSSHTAFLKEEFSDKLVAVEEMPLHEAHARGIDKTGSQYNREASSKDELLQACFQEPHGNVQYNLLSHNHMALVILAFIGKAKWELQSIELPKMNRTISFCDDHGRLSLTAVAATVNGKELLEVINEGVDCEVLSWKMEAEEPTAASVTSAALNKYSDLAMRTTEWSALYTLKGGIIAASGTLGLRVAFASVVERTHMELDSAADDPDLDQLFDFMISIGVGHNAFFDDLANFQQVFINSKLRQLRFAAFGVVNKLPAQCPRVKIAIIKRAYWKKPADPRNCCCNNPAQAWAAVAAPILQRAEDLLLYVHESNEISQQIEPENEKKDSHKRISFYAKVDIDVVSALMSTAIAYKSKPTIEEVQKAMLKAASKHMQDIKYSSDEPPPAPPPFIRWFKAKDLLDQTAVAATSGAATSGETEAKVAVLQFDENTGELLNEQVTFEQKGVGKKAPIEVPCKNWYTEHLDVGQTIADKAAIVTMLESLHRGWDVSTVEVQMMNAGANMPAKWGGKIYLVAGANMPAKSLLLPACVPRGCKVHDVQNEHPMAVRVSVALSDSTSDTAKADHGAPANVARRVEYHLLPEFKAPTAVAANPGEGQDEQRLIYSKDDSESMHPFWAVRRISDAALQAERQAVLAEIRSTGPSRNVPEFNCEIVTKVHPTMCIASIGAQSVTSTRFISVPFITNVKDVVQGEELICELVARPKPKKVAKINWRDVAKEEQEGRAKAAKAENAKRAKAA